MAKQRIHDKFKTDENFENDSNELIEKMRL